MLRLLCEKTFINLSIPSTAASKGRHFKERVKFFSSTDILSSRRKFPIIPSDADALPVFQYPVSDPAERRVYVWGLADHGALGCIQQKKNSRAPKSYYYRPIRLTFGEKHKVSDVSCGYGFTVFAVNTNTGKKVFGSGLNTDSQIGVHVVRRGHPLEVLLSPVPVEIPFKQPKTTSVKQVAAGRAHHLVLTDNEGVFALGNNAYGQCGRKIIENEDYSKGHVHHIPHVDGQKIRSITCGQDHSIFITDIGEVFACGWSADGQTGAGHYSSIGKPHRVKGDVEGENIIKVASSVDCVLAINDKGEVFGWGNSEYGQLTTAGEETLQQNTSMYLKKCRPLGRIVDVAAGGSFCMALNEEGNVFVWGYGILGKGPSVEYSSEPTMIPSTLFGRNDFEPNSRVVSICAGIGHMAAVTNTGNLYQWGRNRLGCLGLGHLKDQFFPLRVCLGAFVKKVSCGVDHTVALCQPLV